VVSHRPHDGRPANPQVAGDLATAWASLPTRRHASARAPWVSTARGPIAATRSVQVRTPAGRLTTAPDPLAPGQDHRPAADRQVAYPDRVAAVQLSTDATADAANQGGGGLDLELPLAAYHPRGENLEAVQAEQPGG
jgi:hypothetical protein